MKKQVRLVCFVLMQVFFAASISFAQYHTDKGLLNTRNFSSKEYKAHPQNWCIVQDHREIIYVGNNSGVLEYDGVSWRLIKVSNSTNVRSIAIDNFNRIYVGARDELGYLSPNAKGELQYVSLLSYLGENMREFGDIWAIHNMDTAICFQTKHQLLFWNGSKFHVKSYEAAINKSFYVNGKLFVDIKEQGLFTLTKFRSIPIIPFNVEEPLVISGFCALTDTSEMAVSESGNCFNIHNDMKYHALETDLVSSVQIKNITNIHNGNFALGTWGEGIIVMNTEGKILQTINKTEGLQDGIIHNMYLDDHENLWMAFSNGIGRIDINSPLSFYNDKIGLSGTIESMTKYKGELYLATHNGIYILHSPQTKKNKKSGKPEIEHLTLVKSECWDIVSFKTETDTLLLVALNDGIYEITSANQLKQIVACYPWTMFQSNIKKNTLYVGSEPGFQALNYQNGVWTSEKFEVEQVIRKIAEDTNGDLWLGTDNQGLVFIQLSKEFKTPKIYNNEQGLPEGFAFAHYSKRWGLTATSEGFLKLNTHEDKFHPDTTFKKLFPNGNKGIARLSEDPQGNIWMVTINNENSIDVGFASPPTNLYDIYWLNIPFVEISEYRIYSIFHDRNKISWLGGPDGLFRFDNSAKKDYQKLFSTSIRKVYSGVDSTLFLGTFFDEKNLISKNQEAGFIPELTYDLNSITFEFAVQSYENELVNTYSYYLDGFDKKWSEWSTEPKAVYTNLPEGSYRFLVKGKNKFKHESPETVYLFSVLPPWYRTWWAYLSYVVLFGGFVYTAVVLSTRGLTKVINEKTAEIRLQKDEIEQKNKDMLDSIHYAKRIQEAILTSDDAIKKFLHDYFVLYKPKDIVSGDFYWMYNDAANEKVILAAVDCTGHGVPGAFMSMIGSSLLNEIVIEIGVRKSGEILDRLREGVIKALKQEENNSKDGMDISLVVWDKKNNEIQYSGANNPLYYIRGNELFEVKATKQPIGFYSGPSSSYVTNIFQMQKGDMIYLFSDGFPDQFGGPKGKKYMYKQLKEFLTSISMKPGEEQKNILWKEFETWRTWQEEGEDKKEMEQIDDVCIIGFRI